MAEQYHKVCHVSEVPENDFKFVWVEKKPVIIVHKDGDYKAMAGFCTHDGGSMEDAELQGDEIMCTRHGAKFNVHTGKATRMPATFGLAKYDIKVEDDEIFVSV